MGGSRPKQYLPLFDRPVLVHALERLASFPGIRGLLLGLAADDPDWPQAAPYVQDWPVAVETYVGGAKRAQTVLNGLRILSKRAGEGDWVLIHDAVRPCIRQADIQKLIDGVGDSTDGGLLALPVSDTVKRADAGDRVLETISREGLWRALTPQFFPIVTLMQALTQALANGVAVTDEASAVEAAGGRPQVVAGAPDNIKITYPADLAMAELYLKQQQDITE